MGGAFADPAVHLGFAGPREIFVEFPWLLPCLLSATFNIGIALIGYFFLDETHIPANPHATEPLLPQTPNGGIPGRAYGGTGSAGDLESPQVTAHNDQKSSYTSRKSQAAILLSSAYIPVQSISKHNLPLTDILLFQILLHPSHSF